MKYVRTLTEHTMNVSLPAQFASLLEQLMDRNPRLQSALIKARMSDEGLRDLAKEVDKIKRGLYGKLLRVEYSRGGVQEARSIIKEALKD